MTLIEVLIAMLVIVIASIATLTYFGPTRGSIGRTGNRRAALEHARKRMEELLDSAGTVMPAQDGVRYCCAVAACSTAAVWTACPAVAVSDNVQVDVKGVLTNVRRETTAQFVSSAGTATRDIYVLDVKVWFLPGSSVNDDFSRVLLRTVRAP